MATTINKGTGTRDDPFHSYQILCELSARDFIAEVINKALKSGATMYFVINQIGKKAKLFSIEVSGTFDYVQIMRIHWEILYTSPVSKSAITFSTLDCPCTTTIRRLS